MAIARLVPWKRASLKTTPRVELNSAQLSVRLYLKLEKEINLKWNKVYFWSDSSIVLSYIQVEQGKFQRIVANKISCVQAHPSVDQWYHVPGRLNSADILSRGAKCGESFSQCETWFNGPEFLYKAHCSLPCQ